MEIYWRLLVFLPYNQMQIFHNCILLLKCHHLDYTAKMVHTTLLVFHTHHNFTILTLLTNYRNGIIVKHSIWKLKIFVFLN